MVTSKPLVLFLLIASPILAIALSWLGLATSSTNPMGWFLLFVGVSYAVGVLVIFGVRKQRFWEPSTRSPVVDEERGDRSFWLISLGMLATFLASPAEYQYFRGLLPSSLWMKTAGILLVIFGTVLIVWARRTLQASYSSHVSVAQEQRLVQVGPYKLIRHPAYAGFILLAIGVGVGYSSLIGLVAILLFLIPGAAYRMRVEDRMLARHFGEQWQDYAHRTPALLPRILARDGSREQRRL